jgi:hypothetical protein
LTHPVETSTIKAEPQKNIRKIESVYYDSMKNAETSSRKNQKIGQSRNFQRKKQQFYRLNNNIT